MMQGMSPGAALRQIQQAHAGLKKARQLLKLGKDNPDAAPKMFKAGWESLTRAHRVLADIPIASLDDDVLTKQLALERYATALLVRLRRLHRQESTESDADVDDEAAYDDEEGEE
jgi:hypothetical protein